jgi:flagellar basal-body rod modification protein FlgD
MSTLTDSLTTGTTQAAAKTSASLLKNVTSYESLKAQSTSKNSSEMGKQDFLTLFTAQLKNQEPLDPVKNEAFVAQLAQFSQLEALTNMQTSLDGFVSSMSSERMLSSTSLIGKKVSMLDAPVQLGLGGSAEGSIDLSTGGASGVQIDVQDSNGRSVQQIILGAQTPGITKFSWDGTDYNGRPASAGSYRFVASAVVNSKTTTVPVNTMATVTGISTASDGTVSLQVQGGQTVMLSKVQQIGQ